MNRRNFIKRSAKNVAVAAAVPAVVAAGLSSVPTTTALVEPLVVAAKAAQWEIMTVTVSLDELVDKYGWDQQEAIDYVNEYNPRLSEFGGQIELV